MGRRHHSGGENKALLKALKICLALSVSLTAAAGLHMLFGEPSAVLIIIEAWIVWALVAPIKRLIAHHRHAWSEPLICATGRAVSRYRGGGAGRH
jgi:hypothetical protein